MKYPDSRLLLLTKAPEPGKVKTRLAEFMGVDAAAEVYKKLVCDCLEMSISADLCPVEIWCSPSTVHGFFQHCRDRYHTVLQQQDPGDIGQRMSHAIMSALQYAEDAVLIGADCPALTANDLEAAFEVLQQGTDVVLGPAEDGGYYLIGMREHHACLFENIPWSTHNVLAATEKQLRERDLSWHLLPRYRDVDTAEDYAVYMTGQIHEN